MSNFIKTTRNSIDFNYWSIEEDDNNKKLLFKGCNDIKITLKLN